MSFSYSTKYGDTYLQGLHPSHSLLHLLFIYWLILKIHQISYVPFKS